MTRRHWSRWVLAAALIVAGPGLLSAAEWRPALAQDGGVDVLTDSAVTKKGGALVTYDDFSALSVTVSQTRGLTNQAVAVTWTGGRKTPDGSLIQDYLQLMQCWGTDPSAPDFRETCQFGSGVPAPLSYPAGTAANLRDLTGDNRDAGEFAPDKGNSPADRRMIPFRTVGNETTPDGTAAHPFPQDPISHDVVKSADVLAPYFRTTTTNEVPFARTAANGTGRIVFEVQTKAQAPGLGCGAAVTDAAGKVTGRPCSLVVVPRGSHDSGGVDHDGSATNPISGSPLSWSNWANRIVFPLDFEPVEGFCALGKTERPTVGSELVADAVHSWQPKLCEGGGTVYGYSQTGDGEARREVSLAGIGAPGLAFTAGPVVPAAGEAPVVHAPVSVSAVVVAFNIDTVLDGSTPGDPSQGTAVRGLKLNPRLVAKLLTQSYQADVPGGSARDPADPTKPYVPYLAHNQRSLNLDPEFLALNPQFAKFDRHVSPQGLIVSLGRTEAIQAVWRWILADDEAVRWLGGAADATGMVVNPNYRDLWAAGAPDTFPKLDRTCYKEPGTVETAPGYCGLDLRPFMNTMHESAGQVLRGDAKAKYSGWDDTKTPKGFTANPPQPPGERWQLTITDSGSAARYGLYAASLRNQSNEYVAPTTASMTAQLGAMRPDAKVPEVLAVDPTKAVPGAYPLTMVTYAAVTTHEDAAARKEYAALLRYAAGPGQVPGAHAGQLPSGYTPLPAPLAAQAVAAAEKLERWVDPVDPPEVADPAAPVPAPVAGAPLPDRGTPPVAAPTLSPSPGPSPARPVPAARFTSSTTVGLVRYVMLLALGLGLVSVLAGPALLRWSRRAR